MQYIRELYVLLFFVVKLITSFDASGWAVDDYGCRTPDLGTGHCVTQEECSFLLNSKEDRDSVVNEYACGIDSNGKLKVCCPYDQEDFDTALNEENDISDHSGHENINLLPKNCGKVQAWGIFSNVSNLYEFGWPALLKYHKEGDAYSCGGTLINNRYILTAAHCVKHNLYEVHLGEYDVRKKIDCVEEYKEGKTVDICLPPSQIYPISIEDTVIHPKYNPHTLKNNVALIRLRKSIDHKSESVSPICLPITPEEKFYKNNKYTVIGWGAARYGITSSLLLKVLTSKTDSSKCNSAYNVRNGNELCIEGADAQASCAGDDGGSLMGYYSSDGKLKTIQYGILSMKPHSCDYKKTPAVYTDVTSYVGWILDNIRP